MKITDIGNLKTADYRPWDSYKYTIASVIIEYSVTSICDYAFHDIRTLKSVTIGNRVDSIGKFVFSSCEGLEYINIPNSINSIGGCVFK